jgi:hypothetical protein
MEVCQAKWRHELDKNNCRAGAAIENAAIAVMTLAMHSAEMA